MGPPPQRGEDWFTDQYRAYYPHIVRYGLRRLADMDASVELAQDVFVVAWQRRAQVPDRSLPWLYGVARRLLANQWRARRTRPNLVAVPDDELARTAHPGAVTVQDEALAGSDIRAALATLNDLDQEILRLVGWEELSLAQAATALDCTRATAAVRLHRARRRLAVAMAIAMAEEPTRIVVPQPRPVRPGGKP